MSNAVHRESMPIDGNEHLLLSVFRFIGAAYETGDASCWEAAYGRAEAECGLLDGLMLVAQATAMIRLIRSDRPRFGLLPPSSRWLSSDEALLMQLVRKAGEAEAGPCARAILEAGSCPDRLVMVAGTFTGRHTAPDTLHS